MALQSLVELVSIQPLICGLHELVYLIEAKIPTLFQYVGTWFEEFSDWVDLFLVLLGKLFNLWSSMISHQNPSKFLASLNELVTSIGSSN